MYADSTCVLCPNNAWVAMRDLVDIPCKPPVIYIYMNKVCELIDYDIIIPPKAERFYRINTIYGVDIIMAEQQRIFTLTGPVKIKSLKTDDQMFVMLGNKVMVSTVNEMERIFNARPIRLVSKGKPHNALIMKDENSRWKNMHAAGILSEDCNYDHYNAKSRGNIPPFKNLDGAFNGQCFYLA